MAGESINIVVFKHEDVFILCMCNDSIWKANIHRSKRCSSPSWMLSSHIIGFCNIWQCLKARRNTPVCFIKSQPVKHLWVLTGVQHVCFGTSSDASLPPTRCSGPRNHYVHSHHVKTFNLTRLKVWSGNSDRKYQQLCGALGTRESDSP